MSNSASNTIAKNTGWLLFGEFSSRILSFGIVVWLTNYLGSTAYGEFAYALAATNILVVIADFGLSTYVTKEVAKNPDQANSYFQRLITIKALLSAVALGAMMLVGVLLPNINLLVVFYGGVGIILQNGRVFIEAFFRAQQKMQYEVVTKLGSSILFSIAVGFSIINKFSVENVTAMYTIASIAGLLWALLLYRIVIDKPSIHFTTKGAYAVLIAASPFAVSILFNYLFNYLDSVMLGAFNLTEATGWYNAAYKPIFFITAIAGMIISAFFPAIAKAWKQHPSKVLPHVEQLFRLNMLVILPVAVGGTILGNDIMQLFFTAEYLPATLAFQLLLWSTALIYVWATFGNSLQACDGEKLYVRGFAYGAVINIILNVILIIPFSLYGAAVATMLTQLFLCGYMYTQFKRIVGPPTFVSYILRPLVAAAAMGVVVYLAQLPLFFSIALGVVSYLLFALFTKALTKRETDFLASIVQ